MADQVESSSEVRGGHGIVNSIVRVFLHSQLSIFLIVLAAAIGLAALVMTAREEDPQIVVPLADVFVEFPGHSAQEVERLVATPLEKVLYEIDGVEYVYSMSEQDRAVITVRFYVGEDRERSLLKVYKRIDENIDVVPRSVSGWVVKPVEIDDVPIVTLALRGEDSHELRRVAEELVVRLARVKNVSRAFVVGGEPRVVRVELDPARLEAFGLSALDIERAVRVTSLTATAGEYRRDDRLIEVEVGGAFSSAHELRDLVVGVFGQRPVFLKDVAQIVDGAAELESIVRHGWGPAADMVHHDSAPGTIIGGGPRSKERLATPAVTIAVSKKKGTNAVHVARAVLAEMGRLEAQVVPDDVEVVITRNSGLIANEKVNELIEAMGVAIVIVIALLTIGLGWREAIVVAVAIPVVFGLTLGVNYLAGYTINRVTLFALILSLGLIVDDPIVDVENISRHFALRKRATRGIVLEAVAEIRPPLIIATLAVIASFIPLNFITGMMGPYMAPMALNVPVAMLMSMLVAFTVTPWLSYHLLRHKHAGGAGGEETDDIEAMRGSVLDRIFRPLLGYLLGSRKRAWVFLSLVVVATVAAASLAGLRQVPLKMLPFDNKNELLLVIDGDEGTTLERSDALTRDIERYLGAQPEVIGYTSYVGLASPMDFNGLVRHYYLRRGDEVAEIRVDLVGKKQRTMQSHAIGLRMRDDLTAIATEHGANLKIVELPPGPPVVSTIVAEVYGRADHRYEDLIDAAGVVRARLEAEPGVVDVDTTVGAVQERLSFVVDREKAAISGVSVEQIARTVGLALGGGDVGVLQVSDERNPLPIRLRMPEAVRSSPSDLAMLDVKGGSGQLVPLAELGQWQAGVRDQTIYHKNLERVVYVFGETAGRAPAEVVIDIGADRMDASEAGSQDGLFENQAGWTQMQGGRQVGGRTFATSGGGLPWAVNEGFEVAFAGEGEWKITLDVFRDLGIAFAAALVAIYVLLAGQTGSFTLPVVVMLSIPLTILGVMPGFWILNGLFGGKVGGYEDPVFFTATAMIGMIALAGIVTRQSTILVDFVHLAQRKGKSLTEALIGSCIVRLRPILLTATTAMLSAVPIVLDPVFSGLAWALIFGLAAATLFTVAVIPVVYWLVYSRVGR